MTRQLPLGFDDPGTAEVPAQHEAARACGSPNEVDGTGPASMAQDPFLAQLAALCRQHPTRAKWVLVPTHVGGNALGDRLAREGVSWANLRFVTPLDLAIRIAGPFLVERSVDPSEEPLGPALMMRLLAEVGSGERDPRRSHPGGPEGPPYFAPLASHTSLAVALWNTLRECRYAGLRAKDLPRNAFASADKHAELVALFSAYERYLEDHGVADMPLVFEEALRQLAGSETGTGSVSGFASGAADLKVRPTVVGTTVAGTVSETMPVPTSGPPPGGRGFGPAAAYCPIAADDPILEFPDVAWHPVVRRFIDALPGQRLTPRALLVPNLEPSARFRALAAPAAREMGTGPGMETSPEMGAGSVSGFPSGAADLKVRPTVAGTVPETVPVPVPGAAPDCARLRFLRAPDQAGPARHDGTLDLFHAGGRDAEIEEVCRRIFASGVPLDAVEIACATPDHARLAWEKARCLDWPVTIAAGLPATMTRPGRALLDWCAWIEGGLASTDLRRALQSGDLAPRAFADTEPRLSTSQAARLLLRAETTWGRATYARTLTKYAARETSRAEDEDETQAAWRRQRAAQARHLLAWVDDLLAAIPEPGADGTIALPQVLDAAVAFLDGNVARASDLDAAAFLALADALAGLRALGAQRLTLALALRFITDAVDGLAVGRSRARPGHLHVSSLGEAGLDARPTLFIVGLEEARVFGSAVEDPVLLDRERIALGRKSGYEHLLRTASDRLDDSVYAVVSRIAALGCAGQRVTLSFSSVDTRDFRETFPSWLILQAYRLKEGNPDLGYESLRKWLGEPASAVPSRQEQSLSDDRWWLAASRAAPISSVSQAASEAFPSIARGAHAVARRASDALTGFDGLVPEAGRALDPTRSGRVVSPTTLEEAARCPFRFFLKSALGVEAVDEGERDVDVWLDPLTRGAELHDLYAALTRRARDAGRRVSRQADLEWFLDRGRARLEELRAEMPPPSEEVLAAEKAEFEQDLAAFIDAEEELPRSEPVALEVSFGRRSDDEDEPLAREEPVEIAVGNKRTLRVAGRIDRIDKGGAHDYHVIDYKTGRYWRDDFTGQFVGGTLLQHALYGRAAEALLARIDDNARVTEGVYWFPTSRGWGKRVIITAPSDKALSEVMGDLVGVLGSGTFTHAPDERTCRWCDFKAACGREPWTAAARKVEANTEGRLDAWRRLKGRQ